MDGCHPMVIRRRLWLGCCLLLVGQWILGPTSQAADPPAVTRVASLAFIEADGTRQSVVEVFSNGDVRAVELRGTRAQRVETIRTDHLTLEELRALHNELVVRSELPRMTTEQIVGALEAASEQSQLTAHIEGAAETEIGFRVGTRWQTVRCPATALLAVRFPDCTEVATVLAAQTRLQNLAAVALLGGRNVADQFAQDATRKLRETHPEATALTRRDLSMVRRLADGSSFVQFRYPGRDRGEDACLVSLTQSTAGPPRVSILDTPAIIR